MGASNRDRSSGDREPSRTQPDAPAEVGWAAGPGDLIADRYELGPELGRGGAGVVFRAHDRVADTEVAIKLLSRDATRSATTMARFRRELQAAWKITHPGVVRVHDLIEVQGGVALSMELVEGETLSARLRRTPQLPASELTALAVDLSRALAAAHRAGVVHRDLKPGNIILRQSTGRGVITDFGISQLVEARELPELTAEGQSVGTPLYMAPEQLLSREVGPAADVYALGLVLFEAAAGRRPHPGTTPAQLAVERVDQPAPPLEPLRGDLPPRFYRIVERCLNPDPAARFASGAELRAALELLTQPGAEHAVAPRRARTRIGLALALVAGVAAAAGGWWWSNGRLPGSHRRVAFACKNLGSAADDWISVPLCRMALGQVRSRERRVRGVADAADANVLVRLSYQKQPSGISITADAGPAGGRLQRLTSVTEASVAAALDRVLTDALERLGRGQPPRGPDPDELADMARLGTQSYEAYRLYQHQIEVGYSAVMAEVESLVEDMEAAVQADPGWAHAYLMLVDSGGAGTPEWNRQLDRALREVKRGKDPVGEAMLDALDQARHHQVDRAIDELDALFRTHPRDIALGWILAQRLLRPSRRMEEAIAVFRRLHDDRPDLQFGANVAGGLRAVGRANEIRSLLENWMRRAPESEQAAASLIGLDADEGRLDDAVHHAEQLLFLHGAAPRRLATLCDALMLAGRTREAAAIADEMLRGDGADRARGWHRLATIAVLEGRLAAAFQAFETAIREGRPFGTQVGLGDSYKSLIALAPMVDREADGRAYAREFARYLELQNMSDDAAVARLIADLDPHHCPKLPPLPDLHRLAASVGCERCASILRGGLSQHEGDQWSLYLFGQCAAAEGALDLARDTFLRVRQVGTSALTAGFAAHSPVHAILARYQLGRVLERQGRPAEARAAYEDFLLHWGHADRRLPEVDEARRALARLR